MEPEDKERTEQALEKKEGKKKNPKKQVEQEKQEVGKLVDLTQEEKQERLKQLLEDGKKNRHNQKYVEALTKPHSFWDKEPTYKWDKKVEKMGQVHQTKTIADVKKQPQPLPEGFEWCDLSLTNKQDLDELYVLLTENYVQDDDGSFRFDYSREFLRWALTPPGYSSKWHIGVRNHKKELVACITGTPVTVIVEGAKIEMGQVNFLCAHKSLRQKRLAPVLIKEVTRRINLKDKWQALYTAGKVLPTPFCQTTYWHRSLNPVKLVDVRFSGMGPNMTKARMAKLYKLPEQMSQPMRPMTKKDSDVQAVQRFLNQQLEKYQVKFHFSQGQVKHYFVPIPNVIVTYVLEDKGEITDMFSFYSLPSHIMKHEKHKMLHACYSYYNFATSMPYLQLMRNALITATNLKYDVYNCLDIMNNKTIFEDLHFMIGDGHLNYYLYNWALGKVKIEPEELSTVLV